MSVAWPVSLLHGMCRHLWRWSVSALQIGDHRYCFFVYRLSFCVCMYSALPHDIGVSLCSGQCQLSAAGLLPFSLSTCCRAVWLTLWISDNVVPREEGDGDRVWWRGDDMVAVEQINSNSLASTLPCWCWRHDRLVMRRCFRILLPFCRCRAMSLQTKFVVVPPPLSYWPLGLPILMSDIDDGPCPSVIVFVGDCRLLCSSWWFYRFGLLHLFFASCIICFYIHDGGISSIMLILLM